MREIAALLEALAGVKSIERGSGELKPFCLVARVGVGVVFSESIGSEKSASESDRLSDSMGSSRSRSRSRSGSGGSFEVVVVAVGVVLWLVWLVWLGSEI